jgi:hypothetical protein
MLAQRLVCLAVRIADLGEVGAMTRRLSRASHERLATHEKDKISVELFTYAFWSSTAQIS